MEVRPIDQKIYLDELDFWLPERIIDVHVHLALADHVGPISEERKKVNWAYEVGLQQSWEDLQSNLEKLFPSRQVEVVVFGVPLREVDLQKNNQYILGILRDCSSNARGFLVTRPEWDPGIVENALCEGFAGIKPYPDLSNSETTEISIYDFVSRSHLEVLNRHAGVLMLHLPRNERLADPSNIRELREISENYPSIKLVVAHIGRSFCLPTARRGLPFLTGLPSVWYDIAAVMNADVIEYAIKTVGPERLLYGSDLPITLIRGYREHIGDTYVNYTDGDYSWNTNRKSPEIEATYTYYLYQELRALISALRRVGNERTMMRKIMFDNAARLLGWE
ncbi:MAG: amidohydrolase family protein [Armatimonadota bacterium]